jgi:uncharacterized protein YjbI with pentapeptide repeats
MAEVLTYISPKVLAKLLKPLIAVYKKVHDERTKAFIRIDDIFGNSRDLAKYYIEPDCQQINPADELEDDAISTVRTNVFSTINQFLNRDIVARDGGASQMFILADAGMGKTSLLMILKLSHLLTFWPSHHHCELLKLGPDTLAQIDKIDDKSNTVLLLDSLDEDPQCKDGGTSERLVELLDKTKVFRRVIITCRTQFFPETNDSVFKTMGRISFKNFACPLVYLALFNDSQVKAYLKNRYPQGIKNYLWREDNPKVAEAEKALNDIGSLQFRPFLLAHIEDITESALNGANEYELYDALTQTWLDREVGKLREKHKKEVNKGDLILVCVWLAETMHRNGKRTVTLEEIKRLCLHDCRFEILSAKPEKIVEDISEIDIGTNSLLNRNSVGEYRFSHLSIGEFLLVYGVSNNIISGLKEPFLVSDKIRRFVGFARVTVPFHFVNHNGEYVCDGLQLINKRGLQGRDLKGGGFSFAQLHGVDLIGADLSGAYLVNADLSGADLSGAHLSRADLRGAHLSGAYLSGAYLVNAYLSGADLSGAILRRAHLRGAILRGVILRGANLDGAILRGANLDGADLREADLRGANFLEAYLGEADLSGADIRGADIRGADLRGADLKGADLRNADFSGADLSGAIYTEEQLHSALNWQHIKK